MIKPNFKIRLDELLVKKGLAESRNKAQRLILANMVKVGENNLLTKPDMKVDVNTEIFLVASEKFVSRGGEKLEFAIKHFNICVKDLVCLDIGSSTGGFTDCLLQNGAKLVYAVDVGTGQLHWKLRHDKRVILMEKTNARYLTSEMFKYVPVFASIDVSFISAKKILPSVKSVLGNYAELVLLIKPQFEAGKKEISKGGVVRSENVRQRVISEMQHFCEKELNLEWKGYCNSPLLGPKGNVEFLAYLIKR